MSEQAPAYPHTAHSDADQNDAAPPGGEGPPWGKQFVKFSFYRLRDDMRAAAEAERLALGKRLASLLERSAERMLTRTYTTIGTRADTDFLIWQVSDDLPVIQDWHAEFLASPFGATLVRPHSYLSMTMRSLYQNPLHTENRDRERLR